MASLLTTGGIVNARSYFQGVAAFNRGLRFRDNPYRFNDASFTVDMLSWYEGWSTAFDVTWRKLTLAQRFKLILGQSKPTAEKANGGRILRPPFTTHHT
jgi:hypothetical protein